MGRIAHVLGFERDGVDESVRVDPGGGANITADHYGPSGDDSPPLPGDSAAIEGSTGAGSAQVAGYSDPANTRTAAAGEKRIYARDSDGAVVSEVWMKGDGSFVFENLNGWGFTISPEGVGQFSLTEARFTDSSGRALARMGDLVGFTGVVAGAACSGVGSIMSGNAALKG